MKNKKGFTLVELIVVMAIIAVLATILIPTMLGFVSKSKIVKANTNAKTIYSALTGVISDYCCDNSTLNHDANGYIINAPSFSSVNIGGHNFDLNEYLNGMTGSARVILNDQGNGIKYVTWTQSTTDAPSTQVLASDQKSKPKNTAVYNNELVGCYPLG